MGQVCAGAREPVRMDMGVFHNATCYRAVDRTSPYYVRKIKRTERKLNTLKISYEEYRKQKLNR